MYHFTRLTINYQPLIQNLEESDDEEDEIEEAAEKIYEGIQGEKSLFDDFLLLAEQPYSLNISHYRYRTRYEDKHNSAQYEAKIAPDLNSMFPVRLSEFDTVGEADVSLPVY